MSSAAAILDLPLVGEIGPDKPVNVEAVCGALTCQRFDRIHLRIDSTGGCAATAFEIFEALISQPVPIAAMVRGKCLSAAMVLFLAASLRTAEDGAEFLVHPTRLARSDLPEILTAKMLHKHSVPLAKYDARVACLMHARTGFDRAWFADQGQDELEFSPADVVRSGIAHEFSGLTPRCDPAWPGRANGLRRLRNVYLPAHMLTQNYYAACATSAFFRPSDSGDDSIRR